MPRNAARMRTSWAASVAVLGALSLAACRTGAPVPDGGTASFATVEEGLAALHGDWALTELEGRPLGEWLPDQYDGQLPRLTIESDGKVGGYGGVNSLGSRLDSKGLVGGEFILAPIAATRRAGPPELMHLEARFGIALERARGFRLLGDTLAITPAPEKGATIARFARVRGQPTQP